MKHLSPFQPREIQHLPRAEDTGWHIKRYAIVSRGRTYDDAIVDAATAEAIRRLPVAGRLEDEDGNHGVAFQIVHFAQVAVVSPVFYWQWGSVLANLDQIRATWEAPTLFRDGVKEVVGCIWEMEIVSFEVNAWKTSVLGDVDSTSRKLDHYLAQSCVVSPT